MNKQKACKSLISKYAFLLFLVLTLSRINVSAQNGAFTNLIGMEFVKIGTGEIVIGKYQPTVGKYQQPDDKKVKVLPPSAYAIGEKMAIKAILQGFLVKIDQPFYLGKYEVTQEQWKAVMGYNPSYFQNERVSGNASRHPVESITWKDAQTFIKKLNRLDNDHFYRLPTEFEWEFAAAAGAPDDISWATAAATGVISKPEVSPVGTKKPNAFGLYDMIGNVWEWVQDLYNEKTFADPIPPRKGKQHVLKGSSFTGDAKNATYKTHAAGPGNGFDIGFRLIMEIKQ